MFRAFIVVALVLVGGSEAAAKIRSAPGCLERFENCKAGAPLHKCETLYEEAENNGGSWADPAARRKARMKPDMKPGKPGPCIP